MSNGATAVERLYGSTSELDKILDNTTAGDLLPAWSGKPAEQPITTWGLTRLWSDDHGARKVAGTAWTESDSFTEEAEQATIAQHQAARTYGPAGRSYTDAAGQALIAAYMPALKRVVDHIEGRQRESSGRPMPESLLDSARQAAIIGLLEAIAQFDTAKGHRRLTVLVQRRVLDALSEWLGERFTARVPQRTAERYTQAMREAKGDPALAAEIATTLGMSRRAFMDAHQALAAPVTDIEIPEAPPAYAGPDDDELVAAALRVDMDARARHALLASAGFFGNPQTDGEIATELGISRVTALRLRRSAADLVRASLSADPSIDL